MDTDQPINIKDLYPDMTEAEMAEAEVNLQRYVAVVLRVYDRLKAEGRPWPDPPAEEDLTVWPGDLIIPAQRSNSPDNAIN